MEIAISRRVVENQHWLYFTKKKSCGCKRGNLMTRRPRVEERECESGGGGSVMRQSPLSPF